MRLGVLASGGGSNLAIAEIDCLLCIVLYMCNVA